jgi:hypothetical protein
MHLAGQASLQHAKQGTSAEKTGGSRICAFAQLPILGGGHPLLPARSHEMSCLVQMAAKNRRMADNSKRADDCALHPWAIHPAETGSDRENGNLTMLVRPTDKGN